MILRVAFLVAVKVVCEDMALWGLWGFEWGYGRDDKRCMVDAVSGVKVAAFSDFYFGRF